MKLIIFALLLTTTLTAPAQSTRKLRSFFTERYVQNFFYYTHPNASEFNGVEVKQISSDRVTLKASFESGGILSAIFGGTYTCTIDIDVDGDEHFTKITTRCGSDGSSRWPCFKWAAEELQKKCRDASRSSRSIDYMERLYGKSLRNFTGDEAMCTLLTIALYNYDY
ncbi:MAG: hypothetical protein IJ928_10910 [Prevotella sp.]|nr:hypothetical protein [Prevotella sp.]